VQRDWVAVALAGGAPDADRAERGLIRAYRSAGLRPPRIDWQPSPWAGASAQALSATTEPGYGSGMVEPAWALIHRVAFGARHDARPGTDPTSGRALARLRAQVDLAVRTRVLTPVVDQIQDDVRRYPQEGPGRIDLALWHLAHLLGAWDGAELACVEASDRLDWHAPTEAAAGLAEMARAGVGLWWCRRNRAVLSPRPLDVRRDAQGRLHSADGAAALGWSDGWAVYAWHGVRVPADLAAGRWDVARVLAEPNAELRRCAIERMGWPRFVAAAGLTPVGAAVEDPGNPGQQIALYDLPERLSAGVPMRILLCSDGTPDVDGGRRRFGLSVPADIADPLVAAAWTYGLDADSYAGAVRRS